MVSSIRSLSLEELIQKLVLSHPALDAYAIAGRLWGEDRLDSQRKKLYRKCNPDDSGTHFNLYELPRLLEILNEGLSAAEKAEKGGDCVIHYLCLRLGLVAHRGDTERPPKPASPKKSVAASIKVLGKVFTTLADAMTEAEPLSSATASGILSDGYEAQASLHELHSAISPGKRAG